MLAGVSVAVLSMLKINDSILLVMDVQGKLATLVHDHEHLLANIERLIRSAEILKIPILWTEQAPDKIGPTIESLAHLLFPLVKPIAKKSFSCYANAEFKKALKKHGRRQILVTGIETQVCVYQTAHDLHQHGYEIHVVRDAVSSRTEANKNIALERMRQEGITLTSAEMALCEWLGGAEHPQFREIMANIKR